MDPRDLKIVAILGAALIAIIAIGIIAGGSDDNPLTPSTKDPNVRYDMTVEMCDSFRDTIGGISKADEGMQYAIIHFRLVNDSYGPGLDLSPAYVEWTVTASGVIYSHDFDTYFHPGYHTAEAIMEGGQVDDVRVFQIPKELGLSDIKVTLEYDEFGKYPVLKHDASLIPDA